MATHEVHALAPPEFPQLAGHPLRWRLLTETRSNGPVEARSAGSHPKPFHRNAVPVMRDKYGINLADHAPKHLDLFVDQCFDWVISLYDRVREVCPEFPYQPQTIHWSIPDATAGQADDDGSYSVFKSPPSWTPASGSCSLCSPMVPPHRAQLPPHHEQPRKRHE